ncbi:uncharacterized protein [Battus philenor]|uniref:uncharacterized protein n=1 Tax=Battus philenor TaxID=42288 RepID=UPI0035CEC9EB
MSEDPLVHLPVDRWGEMKNIFRSDMPRSISGLTILETLEEILALDLDYGFKAYCPYGDLSNGMVLINVKNNFIEVVIQTPNDDTQKLEEALKNTKLIDWTQEFEVPFAPKHVIDCMMKINLSKKMNTLKALTDTFILDKNKPLFDVEIPAGLTFKLLTLKYVELVDSKWPHRYADSTWYFELLTKANLGYGLFKDDELIAWVFIKEMGALGHLYTLEEHRQKGYGELVLKLISNVLLKQKKYVFAFCVEGNASAYKLYQKLGFQLSGEAEWCRFIPSS